MRFKAASWSSVYPEQIFSNGPASMEAALTFDDGPDQTWTPQILDILSAYRVKATFMCVGTQIRSHPHVLKRIFAEGHIIGNHSWSHPDLTKISPDQVREQVEQTSAEIYRLTGARPCLFRPPYGELNPEVIQILASLDQKIILWSVDSRDWTGISGRQVAATVLRETAPGGIILQHCFGGRRGLANTVRALPQIIVRLREQGYRFRSVSGLLNVSPYQ
ncbi:polysaccharide deacetylase family protein [Brevibacillus massiliensis]|uniref:polysaccharide deacetylase family protein n=1 Tax=Brevibacillus massiliensis TaxID=1118054 RepID=UPI0003154614|nr:polysaccharide deacetylase family protein [Brevibacillus massiliensis]